MDESIEITVDAAPPAKDGALSVRNPDHPQHRLVVALREAMRRVMDERECAGDSSDSGLETGVGHPHPALSLEGEGFRFRADALNLVNGVADVIQKRAHRDDQVFDVWVIDDDANVREFHYAEEPAERDRYTVIVREVW